MPVYNVEKTIERAIESVITQTFTDWELIVVNDKSTDNSRSIIEKKFLKDIRITLVDKEKNEGLSAARNTGFSFVTGQYYMFMDSDDWVEKDMINKLYYTIKSSDADIAVCGYFQDFYNSKNNLKQRVTVIPSKIMSMDSKEVIKSIPVLDSEKVFCYAWNKLYRTNLALQHNIKFEQVPMIEDYLYNIALFPKTERVVTLNIPLYHYIKTDTETLSSKYLDNFFELTKKRFILMQKVLCDNNLYCSEIYGMACNIHIKGIFAVLERDFFPNSHLDIKKKYKHACVICYDNLSLEAAKHCINLSKKNLVLNTLFKIRIPLWYLLIGQFLYLFKRHLGYLFHKIK